MDNIFLGTKIYKSLLKGTIKFAKISFNPDAIIQIATFSSGGGSGFSPLAIFKILIKNKNGKNENFEESCLHDEETPIKNFIEKNINVLFEQVI